MVPHTAQGKREPDLIHLTVVARDGPAQGESHRLQCRVQQRGMDAKGRVILRGLGQLHLGEDLLAAPPHGAQPAKCRPVLKALIGKLFA